MLSVATILKTTERLDLTEHLRVSQRQRNGHRGTDAQLALEIEPAVHGLDHRTHNRQPQTGTR